MFEINSAIYFYPIVWTQFNNTKHIHWENQKVELNCDAGKIYVFVYIVSNVLPRREQNTQLSAYGFVKIRTSNRLTNHLHPNKRYFHSKNNKNYQPSTQKTKKKLSENKNIFGSISHDLCCVGNSILRCWLY